MIGRRTGIALTLALAALIVFGDRVAPNSAMQQFHDSAWAPPMPLHVEGLSFFAHPLDLSDRLSRTFSADPSRRIDVDLFSRGRLFSTDPARSEPLLLLGGDTLGRDIFARVAGAARWSLGVAIAGAALAIMLGTLFGVIAAGGSRLTDRLVIASSTALASLPVVYIILALRAALPLVMTPGHVFGALTLLFGLVGWPMTASGVRAILMRERALEYADAARAAGASRARLMFVHLLPAASGLLVTQ